MGELQCLEPQSGNREISSYRAEGAGESPRNEVKPFVVRYLVRFDPLYISLLDEFEIYICQERYDNERRYSYLELSEQFGQEY